MIWAVGICFGLLDFGRWVKARLGLLVFVAVWLFWQTR